MNLVVIESPYGTRPDGSRATHGEVVRNVQYLNAAIRDCFNRGEAPFASHGLYPGALDDATPEEREMGLAAGFAWGAHAPMRVVYEDLGITPGMKRGIAEAVRHGQRIDYRSLPGWIQR